MSFGETLRRLRELRGMTSHRLALEATVSPSAILRMEKGERGIPELPTLLAIAEALRLSAHEKKELFEAGLGDKVLNDLQRYALYYYLLLAEEIEMERTARAIQDAIKDNWEIRGELGRKGLALNRSAVHDLLLGIANLPEYAHLREAFAYQMIAGVAIDLQQGTVVLEEGPILADLLGEDYADADAQSAALIADELMHRA